jgi:hypothetical protein
VTGHPPGDGLYIGVPGIVGGIGMTVVASFLEYDAYVFRYGILSGDVVGVVAAEVFSGPEELDYYKDGEEGEEDFGFELHFKGLKSSEDRKCFAEL